jgi:hypothetical protein
MIENKTYQEYERLKYTRQHSNTKLKGRREPCGGA